MYFAVAHLDDINYSHLIFLQRLMSNVLVFLIVTQIMQVKFENIPFLLNKMLSINLIEIKINVFAF
jgi:hypothetical protein